MSHTMNIKTELRDKEALRLACDRMGYVMQEGQHRLFSSTQSGIGIKLPGWQYPIVIQEDGIIKYDNYNGHWGHIERLHELEAYYGVEKSKLEATNLGYSYEESYDEQTGEIGLTINMERW